MKRQQPASGFRQPSVWLCVALSVLLHALLAWWIFPFDFKRKTPEARRGGNRRVLLVRRQVEPKKAADIERRRELDKKPEWVKTSTEQEKRKPREPDYVGVRDTSASGARKRPDKKEGELLPDQDGLDRKNDIILFDQERQEGELEHDGKKRRVPSPSAAQAATTAAPSPPGLPTPPSAAPSPRSQPVARQENPSAPGADIPRGTREGSRDKRDPRAGRDEEERRAAVASIRERQEARQHRDLLTTPVNFDAQPSLPIPSFGTPEGRAGTLSVSPAGAAPAARPSRPYDPSFTADSQPGFRTHERRTRTTGRFVFGSNASLNVAATPRGQYEELIYRRVAYFWYRECDANRDMIVPGSIQIRVMINTQGQITSMDLLRRSGASVSQQGFTFRAIRSADLPPMPRVVRDDVVGDKMELVFDFNFD